jgi:hypothetical protein
MFVDRSSPALLLAINHALSPQFNEPCRHRAKRREEAMTPQSEDQFEFELGQHVGAGEYPIIGLAPAISGTIFEATGTRLRTLPLAPDGIRKT